MDGPAPISGKDSPARRRDSDGNLVLNKILLQLPPEEFDLLSSKLEFVRLKRYQVVHEAGETLKSAYFCNSGMFSVVNIMPDGKSVEGPLKFLHCFGVWTAALVYLQDECFKLFFHGAIDAFGQRTRNHERKISLGTLILA